MKIIELTSNLNIAITNEEAEMLDLFDETKPVIAKGDLNERQQAIANQLVNKDILLRKNTDGKIIYKKRTR